MDTERLGFVVLAGLALGSSAVLSRFGLQDIAPLSLVALRLGVATVAFLLTLRVLRPGFPRHPRPLLDIAIVGLTTMAIPLSAFTLALQFVSSAVLSIFLGFIPLFTAVLAHFWLPQERLTMRKVAGLLLAFAGVVFLIVTRTTGLAGGGVHGHHRLLRGLPPALYHDPAVRSDDRRAAGVCDTRGRRHLGRIRPPGGHHLAARCRRHHYPHGRLPGEPLTRPQRLRELAVLERVLGMV